MEPRPKRLNAVQTAIEWVSDMPIYACESFLKSVGDEFGWLAGVDDQGQRRCILPYTVVRKPGFRLVRFRIQTIPLDPDLSIEEEKSFLSSAVEYFRAAGYDMIIPGSATAVFRTYPNGAVASPYGTFIHDLTETEDALFAKVHTDFRKKIRSAIKSGVEIKCGMEYFDASYALVADTLKRSGAEIIKNRGEFEKHVLSLNDNVKVFVAEYEGKIHACLISPFSQYSAYTFYGGTIPEPVKGAMHLVHWEAIRTFRAMGVRQFNFQGVRVNPKPGSKQEGILTFKKRFGGEFVQGFHWKIALRPAKWLAYSVAVRLLMGGDIVDRERHKLVEAVSAG